MKRCPHCGVDYFDDMLEFCLEDGARLAAPNPAQNEFPTVTKPNNPKLTNADTVNLPVREIPKPVAFSETAAGKTPRTIKSYVDDSARSEAARIPEQGFKALEIAPLVLSLAHNWWQWIYLNDQYYSSFTAYVFSANFLMWLLLLAAGAAVGLFSLKHSRNKGYSYTGLVILAINLILFLVPKR